MKTIADIKTEKKLSAPKHVVTRRELKYSKFPETACVIPAGTALEVHFSEASPSKVYFDYAGSCRVGFVVNAHNNFTGFNKPPGLAALERYSNDGIAKTCTGARVEPDGFGPDGSPSWLICLGLI